MHDRLTVGTILDRMVAFEERNDPYPWYEALREHGPLVQSRPGTFIAVGYSECSRVVRHPDLHVRDAAGYDVDFPGWRRHSSLRAFANSMLFTNPPQHARMRSLVTFAFTRARLRALGPLIEDMTDQLLDRLAGLDGGAEGVDLMREFAFRLPIAVIAEMLGVPVGDQVWFREVAADVMIALEGQHEPDVLRPADQGTDDLVALFDDLVARRRREPGDDLLSALVMAHDEHGGLDRDELMGNLILLLTAGFDTTTHLIGHGLVYALERPDWAENLREDPTFAEGYVEECLRFEPPVQATSRWAARDAEVADVHIPEGSKVLAILAAANRDPRRYPRPTQFDPRRVRSQPLTFAGGIHKCVGAPLARLEAQLAVPRFLRRFPGAELVSTPTYRARWLARGHDRVAVNLDPATTGGTRRVA